VVFTHSWYSVSQLPGAWGEADAQATRASHACQLPLWFYTLPVSDWPKLENYTRALGDAGATQLDPRGFSAGGA
jgi:hypothetical protein